MRAPHALLAAVAALAVPGFAQLSCASQAATSGQPQGITRICVIDFGNDLRRPARLEDTAQACLTRAVQLLTAEPEAQLYLVATADSRKDNTAGNGADRTEQDMTGEDLRYADVAAYRAINTKAYMVRWLHVNPKLLVPLTAYENGQWLELNIVKKGIDFKSVYSRKTAPILERPCTTEPCASHYEEFLVAQQRGRIPN